MRSSRTSSAIPSCITRRIRSATSSSTAWASDVIRSSLINGVQSDNAYRTSARNTLRFGFTADVEHADALDTNTVLPLNAAGDAVDKPFILPANTRKTGTVAGVYASDEYYLTRQLAITGGLRYDHMDEYVTTDQLSPRLGLVYKPRETTTFHAGYARYFTPPELALSGPTPVGTFANTTLAPDTFESSPVRPERSHYFDIGVTQRLLPGLDVGLDGYYKIAKNLLDDGQFGQALVLTAFNYDHATNDGVELKANYVAGGFRAYGNLAVAQQRAKEVSSNQYLFDADELAYIQNNYIYTDHDQLFTVSGRRLLQARRDDAVDRRHLRQRPARRLRQHRHGVAARRRQPRARARRLHSLAGEADDAALHRRQFARSPVCHPRRLGHRRLPGAVRRAARLLRRSQPAFLSGMEPAKDVRHQTCILDPPTAAGPLHYAAAMALVAAIAGGFAYEAGRAAPTDTASQTEEAVMVELPPVEAGAHPQGNDAPPQEAAQASAGAQASQPTPKPPDETAPKPPSSAEEKVPEKPAPRRRAATGGQAAAAGAGARRGAAGSARGRRADAGASSRRRRRRYRDAPRLGASHHAVAEGADGPPAGRPARTRHPRHGRR